MANSEIGFETRLQHHETKTFQENISKTPLSKTKLIKVPLNVYVEDWQDLTLFRTYKVTRENNLNYTIADAVTYGLMLLEKKYPNLKRTRENIRLSRGRRHGDIKPTKLTSVDLPKTWVNFINDFLCHQVIDKGRTLYTRPEMFEEVVSLIKADQQHIFDFE